jgi:hypothetical protein
MYMVSLIIPPYGGPNFIFPTPEYLCVDPKIMGFLLRPTNCRVVYLYDGSRFLVRGWGKLRNILKLPI